MGDPLTKVSIRRTDIDAVIFDMDGVVTDTASVHQAAWKRLFDEYLRQRSESRGEPFVPFTAADYRRFVDGRPRYDGARAFLASRGIQLPEGSPDDGPDRETVCGLGNRKDALFLDQLRTEGARAFPSSTRLVSELRRCGIRTAIVSASRHVSEVLESAGVAELFDVRVDGMVAEQFGLAGKPDPAIFLEAARQLALGPDRAVVVEDALAGVTAGRRGGFRLVIGVARGGDPQALLDAGADVVVSDLAEVGVRDA
jgi:beta-phosphoglucomutase family hydrolase